MKHPGALIGLALACWPAVALRADVTIRYQTDFKPAAALQPLIEQFMKTAQSTNTGSAIRMKGNKAYVDSGNWIEIIDFVKQDVTLISPEHKTFATFPLSQLTDKLASAMPQTSPEQTEAAAKALASIKMTSDSKVTGHTEVIHGVQAEERELEISMTVPMPASMPQPAGPSMKLVMHIWTAKPDEALRNPAIRELTGYNQWQKYVMNPMGMLDKLGAKMPGITDTVRPMFEQLFKDQSVILRTHTDLYMPMLATFAKQMAGKGQPLAIDPDAPLIQMNQEVAELSSDPVDGSLFEIPKEYTAAPADDLIRDMIKAQSAAPAAAKLPDSPTTQ
jgi:hypothetical protein